MTTAEWVIPVVAYGRVLPEPTAAAAPRATGLGEAGPPRPPGPGRLSCTGRSASTCWGVPMVGAAYA
jgi:hypothetical protein